MTKWRHVALAVSVSVIASMVIMTVVVADEGSVGPSPPGQDAPTRDNPRQVSISTIVKNVEQFTLATARPEDRWLFDSFTNAGASWANDTDSETIVCQTVEHIGDFGDLEASGEVRWCWNITSAPYLIRGYTIYAAEGSGGGDFNTIIREDHNHEGGGVNNTYLETEVDVAWRILTQEGCWSEGILVPTESRIWGEVIDLYASYWTGGCPD